ncbi:hypothetical protein ACVBIO_21310 [Shewanella sp. 0m-8]
MSTESDQVKKELMELVSKNVEADSPEAIEWMEKAANVVRKDQLETGQRWKYNAATGLEKVWVN